MNERKALIAMSGGVDSAVAAALMLAAGYDCIGVTMKLRPDADTSCGSGSDADDAHAVADRLGFPHKAVDWSDAFTDRVIAPFIDAYERGLTPNPCILCNRAMKFDGLLKEADASGCSFVGTGHYARVTYSDGRYHLKKARDLSKDQTYVLYFLSQEQLARVQFPLGEVADKDTVRQKAAALGLTVAGKKESQDICFVPDGKYADFIRRTTGRDYPAGDFVGQDGQVLGHHKGIIAYTVGQRRGLGLSLPAPLYVKAKDPDSNTVLLAPEEALYTDRLIAGDFHWIAGSAPTAPLCMAARTRYNAAESPATATVLPDGRVSIVFDTSQRAVTPGQAVVLYDGDEVLGGGVIQQTV